MPSQVPAVTHSVLRTRNDDLDCHYCKEGEQIFCPRCLHASDKEVLHDYYDVCGMPHCTEAPAATLAARV